MNDAREIPGFPGYWVSPNGAVESRRRVRTTLKARLDDRGYLYVNMRQDGRPRNIRVHTTVLLAFAGPRQDGMEACHNNGDRLDNRADNLRWDTRKANHADQITHGTKAVGQRAVWAKLTDEQVREIKRRLAAGDRNKDIAADFGVHKDYVSRIKLGIHWRHITLAAAACRALKP